MPKRKSTADRSRDYRGALPALTSSPDDAREAPLLTWMLHVLLAEEPTEVLYITGAPDGPEAWKCVFKLARHNVVTVRLGSKLREAGIEPKGVELGEILEEEGRRQEGMYALMRRVVRALEARGLEYCLIKTPDHRPDMGHDLDFLIPSGSTETLDSVLRPLGGVSKERSVCERLAAKVSYAFEEGTAEWHIGALGQVGEDRWWPQQILSSSRGWEETDPSIRIPSPENMFLLQVQQRLYRHFFIRLGDALNSIGLVRNGTLDWERLRQTALVNGVWTGCVAYLKYLKEIHRIALGRPLEVPTPYGEEVQGGPPGLGYRKSFIRFPRAPVVARLYGGKAKAFLGAGQWEELGRVSLLPLLAAGELVAQRVFRRSVFW